MKGYYQRTRAKQSKKTRELFASLRDQCLELLGKRCARCGFDDIRVLQIDHVNGGGHAERKSAISMYKKILALGGIGYQTLCANCNWIKRIENKEHRRIIEEATP